MLSSAQTSVTHIDITGQNFINCDIHVFTYKLSILKLNMYFHFDRAESSADFNKFINVLDMEQMIAFCGRVVAETRVPREHLVWATTTLYHVLCQH